MSKNAKKKKAARKKAARKATARKKAPKRKLPPELTRRNADVFIVLDIDEFLGYLMDT